jgi:hypothetical protein
MAITQMDYTGGGESITPTLVVASSGTGATCAVIDVADFNSVTLTKTVANARNIYTYPANSLTDYTYHDGTRRTEGSTTGTATFDISSYNFLGIFGDGATATNYYKVELS